MLRYGVGGVSGKDTWEVYLHHYANSGIFDVIFSSDFS